MQSQMSFSYDVLPTGVILLTLPTLLSPPLSPLLSLLISHVGFALQG